MLLFDVYLLVIEIEFFKIIEIEWGVMCLIEYLCLIWHIIPLLLICFLVCIFMPKAPPKSSEINEFLGGFYYVWKIFYK